MSSKHVFSSSDWSLSLQKRIESTCGRIDKYGRKNESALDISNISASARSIFTIKNNINNNKIIKKIKMIKKINK